MEILNNDALYYTLLFLEAIIISSLVGCKKQRFIARFVATVIVLTLTVTIGTLSYLFWSTL